MRRSVGDLTPSLLALAVLALATRLALAWRFDGYLSGDDLEVIQAGLRYAVGHDYGPASLRNLFHPIVLVSPWLAAGGVRGGPRIRGRSRPRSSSPVSRRLRASSRSSRRGPTASGSTFRARRSAT